LYIKQKKLQLTVTKKCLLVQKVKITNAKKSKEQQIYRAERKTVQEEAIIDWSSSNAIQFILFMIMQYFLYLYLRSSQELLG